MPVKRLRGPLRMSIKILLLEDDPLFGETLEDFLMEEGYRVERVLNPQLALDLSFSHRYDLYLFDINLPVMSGVELLESLRQSGDKTPAIFLTSHQDKAMMKEGFESGCDDYLKKPVDLDELQLRIHSLMKRVKGERKQCINNVCIDLEQKRLYVDENQIEVGLREFELLALLFHHKDKVVSKEMIFDALWSGDEEASDGAVRVYINRLKKLVGNENIKNIRGVGYSYESL